MSDNVRRIIPSLSMFLFYPFHSFSRFLPIQRGRFGCDLWIFVACSQCLKKVVSFSICFARQVAVVARARKRWSWSCQRIRSRESSAFLLLFGWPGISRAWIFLGSLTTFLCSSLDSWHSSSNNDCQVKTTGQTAHRQCACRQFRNERGLNDLCILKSSSL